MKNILKLFLILIATFISANNLYSIETVEDTIIQTAESGLTFFLNKIPPGQENLYGFQSRNDFEKAQIGKPYHVYTIPTELINNSNSLPASRYLVPFDEWRVPVIVNGEYRAILTIAKQKDKWEAVDFGATALAKEIQITENNIGSEYQRKILIRLYSQNYDFLMYVPQDKKLSDGSIYPIGLWAAQHNANSTRILQPLTLESLIQNLKALKKDNYKN